MSKTKEKYIPLELQSSLLNKHVQRTVDYEEWRMQLRYQRTGWTNKTLGLHFRDTRSYSTHDISYDMM